MLKFLIFLILFTAVGGNTTSKIPLSESSFPNKPLKPTLSCSSGLEEKLGTLFNDFGFEDTLIERDKNFLKELKSCPREETINSLLNLQNKQKENIEIQTKTAYILIKLGFDKEKNEKILATSYTFWNKSVLKRYKDKNYQENLKNGKYDDTFGGVQILCLLEDVIENDNRELLSDVFPLSLEVDGAYGEYLSGIFANEFKKNPEYFLKKLKPQSKKIRQQVYFSLFYSIRKEDLLSRISSVSKTSEVFQLVQEIQHFAENNKYGF